MSRRAANEGTISHRADGRWMGRVSAGWKDGKPQRATVYGKTQAEVRAKVKALVASRDEGIDLTAGSMTVEECLRGWLESKAGCALGTRDLYRGFVENHLVPALGSVKLKALTPERVDEFIRNHPGGPYQKKHIRSALSSAIARAQKRGWVLRNAAALSDPVPEPQGKVVPFTPEEATRILDAAKGDPLEAAYLLGVMLGLRQGEILGLTWDCVDLEAGTILVKQQLQRGALTATKTHGHRTLALPGRVRDALEAHRTQQKLVSLRGLVFTSSAGTGIEKTNFIRRMWHPLLRRAGVARRSFHTTRHSCATFMLADGMPLKVVQTILGHSSIQVTGDIYTHVMPELHRQAAVAMDRLFG